MISSDFTVVTSAGCTATVGGQRRSAGRTQKVSPRLGVILLGAEGSVEDTRLRVLLFGVHTQLSLG